MSKPETCKKENNNSLQIHLYRMNLYRVTTYDTNDWNSNNAFITLLDKVSPYPHNWLRFPSSRQLPHRRATGPLHLQFVRNHVIVGVWIIAYCFLCAVWIKHSSCVSNHRYRPPPRGTLYVINSCVYDILGYGVCTEFVSSRASTICAHDMLVLRSSSSNWLSSSNKMGSCIALKTLSSKSRRRWIEPQL